ncbi:MAG: AcvB/VirJ family lysyl-phosphatidylglycerol hydrolase [Bdellovibrionota bacterium]
MSRSITLKLLLAFLTLCFLPFVLNVRPATADEGPGLSVLQSERFGTLRLYREALPPTGAVILFSGGEGWSNDTDKLARLMAKTGRLIIGVDTKTYRDQFEQDDEECIYLAGELERLSQSAEKGAGLEQFYRPILAGVGDGAALVYIALGQYQQDFLGGIVFGFCPSLSGVKPFCAGDALRTSVQTEKRKKVVMLEPSRKITAQIRAVHGSNDTVCTTNRVRRFFSDVPNASVTEIGRFKRDAGSLMSSAGFEKMLVKQLDALDRKSHAASESTVVGTNVADLPLTEIVPQNPKEDYFVVFVSGDGGWATIDKEVGTYLSENGIPVIGFDALSYFWHRRTAEQTAVDVTRVIKFYSAKLKRRKVVLVGFSLGADVLPFVARRLPGTIAKNLRAVVLLSPSTRVDFEVHISSWIGVDEEDAGALLFPEIQKLKGTRLLCLYGGDDDDCVCPQLDAVKQPGVTILRLEGDHHFDGDYEKVGKLLLENLAQPAAAAVAPAKRGRGR